MKFSNKDWERMLDLIITNSDGESVAKSIKDKNKAAVRFIAGLKLNRDTIDYNERCKEFSGEFACFGNAALKLGASLEEIREAFDGTEIPQFIIDKRNTYKGKNMNSMYTSHLSKAIIDAGFDIKYLHNGRNALTWEGRYAMERNGRKWTIGYETEIIIGETTHAFKFDAITCEGGGPTSYVLDSRSSNIFNRIPEYVKFGKLEFKSIVLDALKNAA